MTSAATTWSLQCIKATDIRCLLSLDRKQWRIQSPRVLCMAGEGRGDRQRCKYIKYSSERMVQHGFMQGFLGLPLDVIEQAVADSEGDLEAAVNSLLQQAERQPDPATPKQGLPQPQQQQPKHVPLQQNGHSPWQDTPTPSGWHIHRIHCSLMPFRHLTIHVHSELKFMCQAVAGAPSPEGVLAVLVSLVQRHLLKPLQSTIVVLQMLAKGRRCPSQAPLHGCSSNSSNTSSNTSNNTCSSTSHASPPTCLRMGMARACRRGPASGLT